ncbi:MAG TPA: aminomethyl-transferring glycine dehydrogenase subunit GcvPB [Candidatus Kapabacteria bacterium]|nr:aminomethyl-transferring glycine dehydrogenase subunit GcvPB [Candidatus Kapabacteria bacterium]HPO63497.1 aminomethyl-transferring glycine dehydrogenase subunit GcvPB [Candidatus Kapabacteria bacterium]
MEKLIFEKSKTGRKGYTLPRKQFDYLISEHIPEKFLRKSELNLPEISEGDISRHYTKLAHLNYSIEEGLYPLGSCTMKYNPKVNEKTAAISGFTELHPCINDDNAQGALELMYNLGNCLKEISGLQGVSLQPSAGSNGEFTGILMFRAYHLANGDTKRTKILIPDSAHGTNPASAVISGFTTVNVKSNEKGRIDLEDLKSKCGDDIAGFMITNPNTLGLFETEIVAIEKLIHGCGGLMYMDGANLNALLGITRPGDMKFDCVHINLHKTFSTPHGGGGPGAGPVCVSEKLVPFLPKPQIVKENGKFKLNFDLPQSIGKIHSFYGNFGILVRALTYIYMHGAEGIREISENAIINANYILSKLKDDFEIPHNEYCMHEFVLSCDKQKEIGFNAKDIAKRLLDYGYHAPTIYFPLIVHEAMLIEPTESESMESLEGFADTMLKINQEGKENPELLTNAPYNAPVRRLDDALAARNLNVAWKK